MTAKRDTPAPRPGVGVGRPASEADTEEGTEERTIEFDVDAMSEELMDAVGGADDGAVAKPVDDKSTGAATPQELNTRRARRNTLVSPIPSLLAQSMRPAATMPLAKPDAVARPAAGSPGSAQKTVAEPTPQAVPAERESVGYSIEVGAQPVDPHSARTAENPLPKLGTVGTLVHKARFCLDAGDIGEAVLAASAAVFANERSPEPEVGDLADTAGGPLARIFIAGPASKVPMMSRADAELDAIELDELHWALLRRMNGHLTLDEVFRATKIPAIDALKIAASLLRDGVIRVQERTAPGLPTSTRA
jgi:hypothetical protein